MTENNAAYFFTKKFEAELEQGMQGMEKIREAVREDEELSRRIRVIADNPPPFL